ncbi:DNAH7.2 family protein [Megaselia abdita]
MNCDRGAIRKTTSAFRPTTSPAKRAKLLDEMMNSKANAQYRCKRLWYDLNLPEEAKEIFNGEVFKIPEHLLKYTKLKKPGVRKKTKSRKFKSYTQMRQERENFRKKLVELIARKDDEVGSLDDEFPNPQEKEILRYYYYIKHGIDTIYVAPLNDKVLGM